MTTEKTPQNTYLLPLVCMVSLFFLFGFVTVLNDILVPHLKSLFSLTNVQGMLVQFCFFGSYFLISLPAGMLLEKIGYQWGIVVALLIVAVGLFLFIPASIIISYPFFLFALFIIGCGITILQVAANPYLSLLGPIETGPSRINLAGAFNSLATTIGPAIGAYFIFINVNASIPEKAAATRVPYLGLAVFVLLLAILFRFIKMPEVVNKTKDTSKESIWRFTHLKLGALALFLYVGAEVAIGSLLIGYLGTSENGSLTPTSATIFVSYYWGAAMVGRFCGYIFLSKVKTNLTLILAALTALVFVNVAICLNGQVGIWALLLLGLCHSVMWPCIFPLSINHLGKQTAYGSALLIMMCVGGALVPLFQGFVIDKAGYKMSFFIEAVCYAYILFFAMRGFKAKPIEESEIPVSPN